MKVYKKSFAVKRPSKTHKHNYGAHKDNIREPYESAV